MAFLLAMKIQIHLGPDHALQLLDLAKMLEKEHSLALSKEAVDKIARCRTYLDQHFDADGEIAYGINTGFGALYSTRIESDALETLQKNLLLSHACGMGEEISEEIVRLILLLKIKGLSFGHSGVQLETVNRLCDMYNEGITPVVYAQGSLGASGDLAPLAHLALPLLGEGQVRIKGQLIHSSEMLRKMNWEPLHLKSKEGLALINGTQFMSAILLHCLLDSNRILEEGIKVAAMSLDAFDGHLDAFDPLTHLTRPHSGQVNIAKQIRQLLDGSEIANAPKKHVQDPYSFRCIPQVHGASEQVFGFVQSILETEMNSVTDNPIIFPEEDKIISGGNFHGQPLALSLDTLAIAVAELGSISERRIYKLISGQRELPAFLAPDAGLNSGFMIPQYTAASIVSQNKQWCTPSSVDTIDSSHGQEDHVSMGANAATKCLKVVENVRRIIAIEYLTAAQALDFRRPMRSSAAIEDMHSALRKEIPFMETDRYLHDDMIKAYKVLWNENQ
jgi:histidine ammonia-lyase